jgi:hypothetical protein
MTQKPKVRWWIGVPNGGRAAIYHRQFEFGFNFEIISSKYPSEQARVARARKNDQMPLADFKKIGGLGKGSYGAVYKVQRKSDQKIYALKEVSIKQLKQHDRQMAVNEIRILASLHHDSIIRYREAFLEKDNIYIVTEFAKGGDLHRQIKKMQDNKTYFHEKTIWHYFVQICRGVEVLHSNKILHRVSCSSFCTGLV